MRLISKPMAAILVFAMALLTTTARADVAAGDTCAGNLTPDGKAIYAAVVAAQPTPETLKSTTEHWTRELAMGGKIGRGSARDNAVAAGECVRLRF
jgi:hypothetical protein